MKNLAMRHPILLVEDSAEDVFLLRHAFKGAEISNPVNVVVDGQEAVDYLAGVGRFADRKAFPLPCLVLLDLKLPMKMGLDVLEWIRSQAELRSLIVIALTSSPYSGDIEEAYRLGANAFLVKPPDTKTLAAMCHALKDFWLVHNRAPKQSS
jgi:CheY-like chemotaxis protein